MVPTALSFSFSLSSLSWILLRTRPNLFERESLAPLWINASSVSGAVISLLPDEENLIGTWWIPQRNWEVPAPKPAELFQGTRRRQGSVLFSNSSNQLVLVKSAVSNQSWIQFRVQWIVSIVNHHEIESVFKMGHALLQRYRSGTYIDLTLCLFSLLVKKKQTVQINSYFL